MTEFNRQTRGVRLGVRFAFGVIVASLTLALAVYRFGFPVLAAPPSGATAPTLASLPEGYRNWALISVASVGSPVNDVRAKLGNDIAINAYRQGTIPFPDGAIIARLAWKKHATSGETNNAIRLQATQAGLSPDAIQKLLDETFVAGPATNIQFMVKDSKKYASTGGWGFAQFTNGKPDSIVVQACFACHAPGKDHDFVFTEYAP
ncbi:MAG: cytochrome P460 family protein [Candidatus Eremiobacteraeota bacterium]|nr:cytochrome P460 family protein [Candidatus Eremiobacteraeota bacterium]